MSERFDDGGEEYPHLALWELETLAERALDRGEIRAGGYSNSQDDDRIPPSSYVLTIEDPEPFEVLAADWARRGFETVTSAQIEYVQAGDLTANGPLMPPVVYVSVSNLMFQPAKPAHTVRKDTTYVLPFVSPGRGIVREVYAQAGHDRDGSLDSDTLGEFKVLADGTRNLTHSDIELLRILLSSE